MTKRSFSSELIFYLVVMALVASFVFIQRAMAIDMVTANQMTIAWDATSTNDDGTPLADGQVVEYRIYIRPLGAPVDQASQLGATEELQYLITFPAEGAFLVGVSAIKYELIDGAKQYSGESAVIWSDDPAVCLDGKDFAALYLLVPAPANNLTVK